VRVLVRLHRWYASCKWSKSLLNNYLRFIENLSHVLEMSAASYLSLGVVKVGVDGSLSPNFSLIIYYVIGILLLINVYKWLSGRGQTIAAAVSVPLIFLILYFFYIRWFSKASAATPASSCTAASADPKNKSSFPPIVNMCPDFMVVWKDRNDNIYCYDANNTYNMKAVTSETAGLTRGLTINGVSGQSAFMILDRSKNTSAKKITDDSGGLRWPMYRAVDTNLASIASDTKGKYLRWEGIIEGTGLTYNAWKQNMARVLPSSS